MVGSHVLRGGVQFIESYGVELNGPLPYETEEFIIYLFLFLISALKGYKNHDQHNKEDFCCKLYFYILLKTNFALFQDLLFLT